MQLKQGTSIGNKLYLGLDQGSSATKAVLINSKKEAVWSEKEEVSTVVTNNTHVTQNPEELLDSVRHLIEDSKNLALKANSTIEAIGFSFQRSGVCAWNRSDGRVVHPLISWRDTSTREFLKSISEKHQIIKQKTFLPVVPHYAGGKFNRLHKEFPESSVFVGTLDTYIINRLSDNAVFITEDTMASRTLLYSMVENKWDTELCKIFNLKKSRLAKISSSIGDLTSIAGIPVRAMLGDQQAAMFGSISNGLNSALMLGTVSSICVSTGSKIVKKPGFVSSVMYSRLGNTHRHKKLSYLIEGMTKASGVVMDFLESRGIEFSQINELCSTARARDRANGPVAFLTFLGTATPDWRYDLPSVISQKYRKDQLARACIESIGSFISENILALKIEGLIGDKALHVCGGLSAISYLLQYIADCTEIDLLCPDLPEESARGAAIAALGEINPALVEIGGDTIKSVKGVASERYRRWQDLKKEIISGKVRQPFVELKF